MYQFLWSPSFLLPHASNPLFTIPTAVDLLTILFLRVLLENSPHLSWFKNLHLVHPLVSCCWSVSFSLIVVFLKVICCFLWLFFKSSLYPVVLPYEDGVSRWWFLFVSPFLVFRMHFWKIQVFLLFFKLLTYYFFRYHFSTILSTLSLKFFRWMLGSLSMHSVSLPSL